jgi:hypothetical protein
LFNSLVVPVDAMEAIAPAVVIDAVVADAVVYIIVFLPL